MRLIDADAKITALLYDDEHEETKRVEMTIADFLDSHTEEGCPQSGGWISVKERMPSDEEVEHTKFGFLCYIEGFFIMPDGFAILPYNKETKAFWSLANNRAIDNVTHWMPLPECPKEVVNA